MTGIGGRRDTSKKRQIVGDDRDVIRTLPKGDRRNGFEVGVKEIPFFGHFHVLQAVNPLFPISVLSLKVQEM